MNNKVVRIFSAVMLLSVGFVGVNAEESTPLANAAPELGAGALVETYMTFLSTGRTEEALKLLDLRGMRQYLLDRRLTELRAKNPELTDTDVEEVSAQLQLHDLNPERLEAIMSSMLTDSASVGMTWEVLGYIPVPNNMGFLVNIAAKSVTGQPKPFALGIKKLGDEWRVAPEIVEELGRQSAARPTAVAPPQPVVLAVDQFWKQWQAGDLNAVYAQMGTEFRQRVPVLLFLQQAQELTVQIGAPVAWNIIQCQPLAAHTLGLGVEVKGTGGTQPTVMVFRKMGETWVLESAQFKAPAEVPRASDTPPPPPAFPTQRGRVK